MGYVLLALVFGSLWLREEVKNVQEANRHKVSVHQKKDVVARSPKAEQRAYVGKHEKLIKK